MNPSFLRSLVLICLTIGFSLTPDDSLHAQETARDVFVQPPDAAKPRGYWLWAHGNFDYTRITEELSEFKQMGLGGVDIFDMGIADPYGIIPSGNAFMGPDMMDGITFAVQEAEALGLSLGLSVSNGWNAGGPWTPPDEMIMRLLFWKDTVQGPVRLSEVGFPAIPTTFTKPYGEFSLFPQIEPNGFPTYYEDVALFAYPLTAKGIIRNPEKARFFDITQLKGNQTSLELPAGKWVLTRAVVSPLGQRMWMQSDQSDGFIMDHYSKKATHHHFTHIIDKLEERLGNLENRALDRLYLASFEAEDYIIWSPELRKEFFAQHGYELDTYMPVFAGQQVIDEGTTRRFLHDYRSTVSEMFVNNHYRQARDICHAHGLLLSSESGGPGPPLHYVPTEDLKALGSVDIMRGEFWNKQSEYFDENGNDLLQVVRNIASAAHIYGHKVVEMESFTSHLKHWQERPMELKKLADRAFCEGMTRVVYHTMPHSPKEAGIPGWSYQAGTHISPKMAWWSLSKPFHAYLARTSALLQHGDFVADVAYYYGEQIPNFASGSKFVRETLGPGYDYDDLNKEILLQSTVTDDGKLLLPSGMTYALLVLPDEPEMSLEVLQKIEELLNKGATILGNKPSRVPGLKDYRTQEAALKTLANKIWGKSTKQQRPYGAGTLVKGYAEREILMGKGISPDFQYTSMGTAQLDYLHRSSDKEDIYFIRNPDSTFAQVNAHFRVSGKQPYRFDPSNGTISPIALYTDAQGKTTLPLELGPWGSTFIVFSDEKAGSKHVVSVAKDGQAVFPQRPAAGMRLSFTEAGDIRFQAETSGEYQLIFSDGTTRNINSHHAKNPRVLSGNWQVRFPHGWGFDPIQEFEQLIDWRDHPNKELSIFSGVATYKASFTLEKGFLDQTDIHILDLGKVGEVAKVYLNGQLVGSSVFSPHRFEVQEILREGTNNISIDVANTWLNQLIGEASRPLDQQRTRSNLKSGDKRPWSDYLPSPAGLIGPVTLQAQPVFTINNN